jgi:hypothetical protein
VKQLKIKPLEVKKDQIKWKLTEEFNGLIGQTKTQNYKEPLSDEVN